MKETLKRIWKDPVWSNVIAGIILILIPFLVSFFSPVFKKILHIPIPLWGCLFIIFITYISTRLLLFFSKKEKAKRIESLRIAKNNELMDRQEKEQANLILACLNDQDLKKLSELFKSTGRELEEGRTRIVPDSVYDYYYPTIDKTYTPTDRPGTRFVNIITKRYADKIIYTFSNKYFYSILENYVLTGEKKKIEIYNKKPCYFPKQDGSIDK